MTRIEVLGPLQVSTSGPAIEVTGQGAILLAWLAMHANRPVPVAVAARILNDDVPPPSDRRARTVLRQLATQIPELSSLPAAASADAATVRLAVTEAGLDAAQLTALSAAAWQHREAGERAPALQQAERALELWRGDPYPELAHVTAALAETARLRRIHLELLELQQDLATAESVDFTTIAELRRLVADHPERLGFRLLLARALHLLDRQADAMAVLRQATRDLGEHPANRQLTDLVARRDRRVASVSLLDRPQHASK